jgi:hypothetical protein
MQPAQHGRVLVTRQTTDTLEQSMELSELAQIMGRTLLVPAQYLITGSLRDGGREFCDLGTESEGGMDAQVQTL